MIAQLQKHECVGCGSCSQICPTRCITMQSDSEGFLYPRVDESRCIGCNRCEHSCPVFSTENAPLQNLPEAYVAWTTSEGDLLAATSGGVFTAVARKTLADGGVVVGAAYDKNHMVRHEVIESATDLHRISRSKYTQSVMGDVYGVVASLLKGGRDVIFCGTPCQVYAVKAFCGASKIDTKGLVTIDIVCHGVPSPLLLSKYLSWASEYARSQVVRLAMRERVGRGSFGSPTFTRIDFANGRTSLRNSGLDPLGYFFYNGFAMRPSCHRCPFKTVGRDSDLTIGDCWFSRCLAGDDVPYEVSLCLVQSETGRGVLEDCPCLETRPIDASEGIVCNGGMLYQSSPPHPQRDEFLAVLADRPFGEVRKKFMPFSPARAVKRLRARTKLFVQRVARHSVVKRAEKRQRQEYLQRIRRTIPAEALCRKVVRW